MCARNEDGVFGLVIPPVLKLETHLVSVVRVLRYHLAVLV